AQIVELGLERVLHEIELPLVPVLREMEILGVRLNLERLAEITERVREEIDGLQREIYELAGEEFLIASPQQLGEILFGKLGLSTKRRGKTGYSTDARVLQAIRSEHEIVPKIERWREPSDAGEDAHTATASHVFGVAPEQLDAAMRSKAKMINYGIVYGLSDYGLADRLNIAREEAKDFIDAYLDRFPRVAAFIEGTIE